jgi:hypothetical protein
MPSFTKTLLAILLATSVAAIPVPQLAGEGAAANSILSETDNAIGYGIEDAEDNIAANIVTLKGALGGATGGATGAAGGAAAPPPPPGRGRGPHRRQLDKISNGFQGISNAAGTGSATSALTNALNGLDGSLTGGAADAGAKIGSLEVDTLRKIGSSVPKM